MTLRGFLQKKDRIKDDGISSANSNTQHQRQQHPERSYEQEPFPQAPDPPPPHPEFKFIRTDTVSEERIHPPSLEDTNLQSDPSSHAHPFHPNSQSQSQCQFESQSTTTSSPSTTSRKRFSRFRRHSNVSSAASGENSPNNDRSPSRSEKDERPLSQRLHLNRSSRAASTSSGLLPADLPQIGPDTGDAQELEAQWEKRATVLVQGTLTGIGVRSVSPQPQGDIQQQKEGDESIQEAIRLHETGQLIESTRMFGKLADPNGANNALSQVLYGLALRHGWGCTPNPDKAVTYISAAAANSALIEAEALRAGIKKGGAAKGELVLAIYELANCFRNGWGVAKDSVAARHYYETAANLGDTDAMNEAAWCFLEGFGGKKDRAPVLVRLNPSWIYHWPSALHNTLRKQRELLPIKSFGYSS
ncbi:hypothetical protein ACO22_05872 [Paracoccidioides brasiliensis]|uniref:Uncharacterized protein n=1 Tax=Paracoccidioides brasiliensis TaxID=121759 RepID=A0A1D2J967_PARBR|nr:hypothetical protein ACO22_05872 [Paracoccidioides brasiliensis]ODH52120.1 hypothetical protein GX48_01674 [Paracoccidioides brasiliensis]